MNDKEYFQYAHINMRECENSNIVYKITPINNIKYPHDDLYRDITILYLDNNRINIIATSIPSYGHFFYRSKNSKSFFYDYIMNTLKIDDNKIFYKKPPFFKPWKKEQKCVELGRYYFKDEYVEREERYIDLNVSSELIIIDYSCINKKKEK